LIQRSNPPLHRTLSISITQANALAGSTAKKLAHKSLHEGGYGHEGDEEETVEKNSNAAMMLLYCGGVATILLVLVIGFLCKRELNKQLELVKAERGGVGVVETGQRKVGRVVPIEGQVEVVGSETPNLSSDRNGYGALR
jgi:hypothetical protein